jgi:DNA/RNA-binding domain of Phe-tRNA-synthetase-like protein
LKISVRYSESIRKLPWSAPLGVVIVVNANTRELQQTIPGIQGHAQADTALDLDHVRRRIQAFERFFAENGFQSPLSAQFEQIQRKGLPPGNPLVQALLLAEMKTGLLMGAQDAAAVQGELIYDLAQAGETFSGMRSEVRCSGNEIVLRDREGIIASLFQGPDHRTRLSKSTKDVVFFIFSVPTISAAELREGVGMVSRIFKDACENCEVHVYEHGPPVNV